MNKSKLKATIFILVLLVVAAAVTAIATGRSVKTVGPSAKNTTPPSKSQIVPPSQTPEATASESTEPTESPEPSETPEPTPSPTPTPAVPVINRTVSGSGSFASNTGTPLNLSVKYTAAAKSNSEVSITFDLYLNCYTINATAKPGGASVTFNGKTYTMSTPELSSSSATSTSVKLCSTTVTVPLAAGESLNVPVSASWAFGGKYSNVDLATIDASGTLSVQG